MSAPASSLPLLRSLLRASSQIPDYNISSYARRRILSHYRSASTLSGPDLVEKRKWGEEQLEVVRRCGAVAALYPGGQSVMQQHGK